MYTIEQIKEAQKILKERTSAFLKAETVNDRDKAINVLIDILKEEF